ncbi:E3 SUMO-protein ligase PIAS2 isoform X2 [Aethina tumida]|uniref:E3 SUMO-protein ligase PIAS2 isoform X2 n=1 Tax=Aethina tumida TaxID=116153 RepID=UPI00096B3947|nr:E3 SUMO-protein ligase PIAS2 isoform X2 [Aethina tumida]
MSENIDELRNMLVTFRVSELQMLLGFAGRNKSGRKNELQQRALELLRVRSHPIHQKIRDLYKTIHEIQPKMVSYCYVCKTSDPCVSLHVFPTDKLIREKWLKAFGLKEDQLFDHTKVCSKHFEPDCFTGRARRVLSRTSVPTLLLRHTRQSGALTGVPASTASSGNKDLQTQQQVSTAVQPMPQTQGNGPRSTATVHPYNVDARQLQQRTPMYQPPNMYQPYPQFSTRQATNQAATGYPIQPDVRFRRLPFFDVLADLLKPSTLVPTTTQRMQEGSFYFHLTPQQATDVASSRDIRPGVKCDYVKQVQMRFCLLETTCEQEDYFPPNVMVKVNNKLCPLPNPIPTNKPGVEPKRPPKPVNITQMVKLSPTVGNTITVSWQADYGRGYAITVCLVHKLTSQDLLQRLKNKGVKHSDHTRALIKEKLTDDGDCEIATTSLKVSLMCPLGKMRMTTPCRSITCSHLQCFDASLFLQMNERKPTWMCPVCDKPALYDNLVIDGYFQEVLSSNTLPSDASEIQLHKDGSWSTQQIEKKPVAQTVKAQAIDDSIEIITDDVEIVSTNASSSTDKVKKEEPSDNKTISLVDDKNSKKDVVDLTLSDSDDDEPLAKRRVPNPKPDSTIKFSDANSISSTSNQSRVTTTPCSSSVSSSGYPASPNVINLDSPSPPRYDHLLNPTHKPH